MPNTIWLKFSGRYDEGRAGAAGIKPGHLVTLNSANEVVVHPTAGAKTLAMIVGEDALQGKTVDDTYADDDLLPLGIMNPGDEALVMLQDEQNIAIGAKLQSAGDGTLIVLGAGIALFEAREALNLVGAAGNALIKVRAL